MITFSYAKLNNQNVLNGIKQLSGLVLPFDTATEVMNLTDAVMRQRRAIGEEYYRDILEKFGKKNEDGTLAFQKDADGKPDLSTMELAEETKDQYEQAVKEFDNRTVTLLVNKIKLTEVSASLLNALGDIIEKA